MNLSNLVIIIFKRGLLALALCLLGQASLQAESHAKPLVLENVITVTTTADVIDDADGQCSLREAVISANDNVAAPGVGECQAGQDAIIDVIVLQNGATYPLTIDGAGYAEEGSLNISDNLAVLDIELRVSGNGSATIDAEAISYRILRINDATVNVTGVTFRNADIEGWGGAIRNTGILTLVESEIINNKASLGGGIYNNGQLVVIDSDVINNEAKLNNDGGGIYHKNGLLTLGQSQIENNTASKNGGGIYNDSGTIVIEESTLSNNETVDGNGGAIYNEDGNVTMTSSTLAGNKAKSQSASHGLGGAIFNDGSSADFAIVNSTFNAQNEALYGGAIFNEGASITLQTSLLQDSRAIRGGAIYNEGELSLSQTRVTQNQAQVRGGGIYNDGDELTIEKSDISQNELLDEVSLRRGGGLYHSGGTLEMTQSSLVNNSGGDFGGGVYISDGEVKFGNVTIGGNSVGNNGGGLFMTGANTELILWNVTIANNQAVSGAALTRGVGAGQIRLGNTILAGPMGKTCWMVGSLKSDNYNVLRDDTCLLDEVKPKDQVNTDPKLGALVEQEGTFVYIPAEDSSVIDKGSNDICNFTQLVGSVDQLGTVRPVGASCDIGAVEWQAALPGEPVQNVYLPLVVK